MCVDVTALLLCKKHPSSTPSQLKQSEAHAKTIKTHPMGPQWTLLMTGMSTMYDVRHPLAVEVQQGSHEGRALFTGPKKAPGIKGGVLLSLLNNNACVTCWLSLTVS